MKPIRRISAPAWPGRPALAVALLVLLGSAAGPSLALQDDDLLEALGDVALYVETEQLVSGATRRVAKLSEAPGTIAVIEGASLEERGVLTLGEAIRYVTSIHFSPGTIAQSSLIRDIEQEFNNKVLLLQDGRVLNGVFRGNFFLDLSQPIDNVERIEVVRGPGSALYGANAFAGFINVITRRGDQIDGIEATATVGSDSLLHVGVLSGGMRKGRNWTAEGRYATTDGQDPVNPDTPNSDHSDAHLAFHLGQGDSKGERWFVNASFTSVQAGVPGAFGFPTPGDEIDEQRISLDGFRLWEPTKKTKLKLRGYYNRQDNQYTFRRADVDLFLLTDAFLNSQGNIAYDPPGSDGTPGLAQQSANPNPGGEPDTGCEPCDDVAFGTAGGGTFEEWEAVLADGLPQATDVFDSDESQGFVELQADWQVSKSNYLLGGLSLRLDDVDNDVVGSRKFENYALFVEDEQRFLDDELILLGSLRLDDHSFFGLSVSPRVSLIWSPHAKLIMKGAFGKAFRSPNFVELFGQNRVGAGRLFGAQRAIEEGVLPEEFTRRICLDEDCTDFYDEVISTPLEQEEIATYELWTEYRPVKRFGVVLNLYHFEIQNEVGVAIDANDIYFYASGSAATQIRPPFAHDYNMDGRIDALDFTFPVPSLFQIPGLEEQPTLGVFLNAPDTTRGTGAELEIRANPWDWLDIEFNYSRRENRQAQVLDFVEEDAASANQLLKPTFGIREFSADQVNSVLTFRKKDRFWASLRARLLGKPDSSAFSDGSLTSDVTLGYRHANFTVAGTVLNWNEGGTFFDLARNDFVDTDAEVRLSFSYKHDF